MLEYIPQDWQEALAAQTRAIVAAFSQGAHIFNLGHGITPDADPRHIDVMLNALETPSKDV